MMSYEIIPFLFLPFLSCPAKVNKDSNVKLRFCTSSIIIQTFCRTDSMSYDTLRSKSSIFESILNKLKKEQCVSLMLYMNIMDKLFAIQYLVRKTGSRHYFERSLLRKVITPKGHYSENAIRDLLKPRKDHYFEKGHYSEGSLLPRVITPKM